MCAKNMSETRKSYPGIQYIKENSFRYIFLNNRIFLQYNFIRLKQIDLFFPMKICAINYEQLPKV